VRKTHSMGSVNQVLGAGKAAWTRSPAVTEVSRCMAEDRASRSAFVA
jgi:hypothetical protein